MEARNHRENSGRKQPGSANTAISQGTWRGSMPLVLLRVLTALALGADALFHARLAPGYQLAAPDGIGEGNLFLIEAAAAAAAALYVLIRPCRAAYTAALVIAAGGLVALLLYRYIDVPAFGPFPSMYEPIWFPEKALTALAETVAAITAATALLRTPARADRQRDQP